MKKRMLSIVIVMSQFLIFFTSLSAEIADQNSFSENNSNNKARGIVLSDLDTSTQDKFQDTTERVEKPDFSHKRGFYFEPFDLILTAEIAGSSIRYTTDNTKPSKTEGIVYTEPVHIQGMTTIRAIAYQENTICSGIRTHSFIFPADVLTQDDSGVPNEQHGNDHVYWTEEFDMNDVDCTEEEMIGALLDLPSFFISVPWDSMFGIAGIHRGQNLEEHGGDPNHPDWIELVECSVELIYPKDYYNGIYNNWQENCGIKIQGGVIC